MIGKLYKTIICFLTIILALLPLSSILASLNTHSTDLENGSNQYWSIADADQTGLDVGGDFTFEMWIREESAPSSVLHALIEKEGNGQATGYYFIILGQKIRVHFYDASANNSGWDSTNNVITSQDGTTWYHVAAAVDVSGPSIAMYINGSSVATTAIGSQTATSVGANAYPFTIGEFRATAERGFDGLIDEVRVWNDIRTPTEISDNYEKELAGTEANLVGYWKFNNDGTDSQTSGNNDLTNNNTATFSTTVPFAGESTTVDADNSQVISFF